MDYLIMDLRPQNIFFDPKRGEITVIDIGASVNPRTAAGPRPAPDVHDCLAELCKFYLEPQIPPTHPKGYRDPYGMGPALGFARELDRMIEACAALASVPLRDLAWTCYNASKTGLRRVIPSVMTCSSISPWLMSVTASCKIFQS
jgi:hypothetical protein